MMADDLRSLQRRGSLHWPCLRQGGGLCAAMPEPTHTAQHGAWHHLWLWWPATRSLARFFCKGGTDSSLLTFYRLAVHQPLDRRLGVPVGSTHQPAVLAGGQDEVLGFIQPVWSSFKIHQCTSLKRSSTTSSRMPSPLLPAEPRRGHHRPLEGAFLGAMRAESPLPLLFAHTKTQPFISVKLCWDHISCCF